MSLVLLDHGRNKLLDGIEVRKNVDAKDAFELVWRYIQDSLGMTDTCIVDKNGSIAKARADCFGCLMKRIGI